MSDCNILVIKSRTSLNGLGCSAVDLTHIHFSFGGNGTNSPIGSDSVPFLVAKTPLNMLTSISWSRESVEWSPFQI